MSESDFKGWIIGGIIGIILGFLLGPLIDALLIEVGFISSPKLSVSVDEFSLISEDGILVDKSKRENLGDIYWKDSFLFYVIDIKNEETSDKFLNNLLTAIIINGTIFKIEFNSIYQEKCEIERPSKVRLDYGDYYRDFNPNDAIEIKKPVEIAGSRTLVISCNNLAPGELISLHVYADSKGICNKLCGWDKLGYFSEYWWGSHTKINKETLSGKIIQ